VYGGGYSGGGGRGEEKIAYVGDRRRILKNNLTGGEGRRSGDPGGSRKAKWGGGLTRKKTP